MYAQFHFNRLNTVRYITLYLSKIITFLTLVSRGGTFTRESRAKAVLIERFAFTNICFFKCQQHYGGFKKVLASPTSCKPLCFCTGVCLPHAPYALSTSSCLQEFEPVHKPISGTGLVPIGILVSSTTNTHRTEVTQGACLRA